MQFAICWNLHFKLGGEGAGLRIDGVGGQGSKETAGIAISGPGVRPGGSAEEWPGRKRERQRAEKILKGKLQDLGTHRQVIWKGYCIGRWTCGFWSGIP